MLLYYITDRTQFPGNDADQRAALLLRIGGGARRSGLHSAPARKTLAPREVERLARDAVRAVRENSSTTKLLINARTDIALACDVAADGVHLPGVHLPSDDLPASEVRSLWMKCANREPRDRRLRAFGCRRSLCRGARCNVRRARAPIFGEGAGYYSRHRPLLRCARPARRWLLPPTSKLSYRGGFCVLALGGVTQAECRGVCTSRSCGCSGDSTPLQSGDVGETVLNLRDLPLKQWRCAVPEGTPIFKMRLYPALTRWANQFRPSG